MSVAVRTGAACLHWTSSSLYMSGGGRQDEVFMWRHWHQHLHLAQPQPLHTATALDHTQNSTLHTSDWKYFSLTHWNCGKYLRNKNISKIFPQSPCSQSRAGEGQGSVRTGAGTSVSPGHRGGNFGNERWHSLPLLGLCLVNGSWQLEQN